MRILLIDVGRGTTDILLWDDANQAENQTHLIVPSATRQVAKEIAAATARRLPVLFTGELMGGGPNTEAMRRHVAAGLPFYATAAAAKTFDDDLTAVAAMGVQVLGGDETGQSIAGMAQTAQSIAGMAQVRAGDVRFTELKEALRLVGEDEPLDACALAVQDHGEA
ncbi:MAG: hypothetical protein H5T84_06630, partial [Thermoleophilia bacterium]|nr:hypothetical protein [Thermoleophilia bacterium]